MHRKKIAEYSQGVWYKRQTVIKVIHAIANFHGLVLTKTLETKKWIIDELPNILETIREQKQIRQGTEQVAAQFIKNFAASSSVHLEAYADELVYEERLANHGLFLCQTVPQFKDVLLAALKEKQEHELFPPGDYHELSLQKKYLLMHELFIQYAATIFDLEVASWNPLKSIKMLKGIIEEKGALIASGRLGKGCSKTAPMLYKTDQLYEYYKWNSDHYQKTEGVNAHFVTIVKIEEEPEEHVIFLDPADGSQIGQRRKVYMLPYQIFCQNVAHTSGIVAAFDLDSYLWCRKSSVIKSIEH